MSDYIRWIPLEPGDLLILGSVLIALFGERLWKCVDTRRRRKRIRAVLSQLLGNLRFNLIRIRDVRNEASAKDLKFSSTSNAEISHYFVYFEHIVLPNLDALSASAQSVIVELFDHYRMNMAAIEGKGTLTMETTNRLIERIDTAIDALRMQ